MNNKVLNFFREIYVVNLPERKNRRLAMEKELSKFEIEYYNFFNAERGKNGLTSHNNGTLGRAITEYKILKKCIENNVETVLILEDDIEILDNFYEVLFPAIQEIPNDWALFYLGITPGNLNSIKKYSENLSSVNQAWGCFAICYSRVAMQYIIDYFDYQDIFNAKTLPLSIDGVCGTKIQKDFPCFCTNPPIVCVKNMKSDISKEKYRQKMGDYCKIKYNLIAVNNGLKKIKE
jgi:GR25 family glycosyltransferase involved in LPS biosynthesis